MSVASEEVKVLNLPQNGWKQAFTPGIHFLRRKDDHKERRSVSITLCHLSCVGNLCEVRCVCA